MLKFAHSLSIAFGFMVACAQSLCGVEKSADSQVVFAASENGVVAKICAQMFKNLAQKKSSDNIVRRKARPLESGLLPDFDTLACEISDGVKKTNFDAIAPSKAVSINTELCKNIFVLGKSHPIRAPSAA